jgi:hypothetical protein
MGSLDLVGVAEAAEILSRPPSRVKRWQASGKMPVPVAEPRSTPVWHREDVEALRDGATTFPEREKLPLIGFGEVAELLRVDRSTVGRWRRAGTFPDPDYELRSGPLWMQDRVLAHQRAAA